MILKQFTIHFKCPVKTHAKSHIQIAWYNNGVGAYCTHPKCKAAVFMTDEEIDDCQFEDKTVELIK